MQAQDCTSRICDFWAPGNSMLADIERLSSRCFQALCILFRLAHRDRSWVLRLLLTLPGERIQGGGQHFHDCYTASLTWQVVMLRTAKTSAITTNVEGTSSEICVMGNCDWTEPDIPPKREGRETQTTDLQKKLSKALSKQSGTVRISFTTENHYSAFFTRY